MPIGLGLAASHNGFTILTTPEGWEEYYRMLIRNTPQPPSAAAETADVLAGYIRRVQQGQDTLRRQLAAYKPDLLVIVGGDQTEMFDSSNVPNVMIFLGDQAWGHNLHRTQEPSEETLIRLTVDRDTSVRLAKRLTGEGFDVALSEEQYGMGRRGDRGLPHAFIRPGPAIMPRPDLPMVLIYENTYDPPSLSASRCYELGRAIARHFANDPRRVAILGSGGLSHDPGGPRSGWVDDQLDRWMLAQIAAGKGEATQALYSFDSMTMRSGTGEIRAWITTAGAMEASGARAAVVDYIPANHAVTGMSWAYWVGKLEGSKVDGST